MLKIAFALILGLASAEPLSAAADPCCGVKERAVCSLERADCKT
jgi:hypothetical protein